MAELHVNMRAEHEGSLAFVAAFFKEVRGPPPSEGRPWMHAKRQCSAHAEGAGLKVVAAAAGADAQAVCQGCSARISLLPEREHDRQPCGDQYLEATVVRLIPWTETQVAGPYLEIKRATCRQGVSGGGSSKSPLSRLEGLQTAFFRLFWLNDSPL